MDIMEREKGLSYRHIRTRLLQESWPRGLLGTRDFLVRPPAPKKATAEVEGGKGVEELLWPAPVFTLCYNLVLSYDWGK